MLGEGQYFGNTQIFFQYHGSMAQIEKPAFQTVSGFMCVRSGQPKGGGVLPESCGALNGGHLTHFMGVLGGTDDHACADGDVSEPVDNDEGTGALA